MKKINYVANDVAMRWFNRSVTTINTLKLLDIYRYRFETIHGRFRIPTLKYNKSGLPRNIDKRQ